MYPPFAAITAAHLFGIESTKVLMISGEILFHASITFSRSSFSEEIFILLRTCIIWAHKFSMGLRSGDCGGQSITFTPFTSRKSNDAFDLWHGACPVGTITP